MARIRPFRALRYHVPDLEAVVAPPYDVISEEERAGYLARSPYNVVHLTLPDSEEQAARDLAAWQEEGVLVRDPEPSYWWLAQDYVGPDGVARRREGFIASLHAEPYESRVILPHERTHAGPKEGRLRPRRRAAVAAARPGAPRAPRAFAPPPGHRGLRAPRCGGGPPLLPGPGRGRRGGATAPPPTPPRGAAPGGRPPPRPPPRR